ncbi:phage tail tape measure protein [Pseudomonas fluorescens]|uniref:phage tail tape measure protein n=1 Tax=Pseudomonas fluorescens TaxID=294 RepID=UPI00177CEDAD|nr:phage tail tape measure protein [Pseudomonas fluorescens]MBD8194415.1 phage tail tape measure protein [Pseudomonas fluorescens]MBD8229150.1 phage tail tape measure protein [Pseudomonas fluorescens]MBD8787225.1 phage tail tape measure protein [Pseudomonas fluorescens]MBD8819577.1 phage tail tape measure protein [Pseudomonas fluorescens]
MNIAELGVKIDSADAIQAKKSLDEMAKAGGRAEQSAVSLMNEMQALEKSLSTSAKTTQDLAKQRDALAKLTKTGAYGEAEAAKISAQLDKQQIALAKSALDEQKALNSLLGAIDPARAALAKLDTQVEQLGKHLDAGRISQDQYNSALGKIDKDYAKLEKTTTGFDKLRLGTRQAQENVVQLGNALSSGDWGSGVRAVAQLGAGAGSAAIGFAAIAAPIALAAGALAVLTNAYYQGSQEAQEYNKSLILTGNYAGTSSSELAEMAKQIGATVGTTGAAADVLASLAGNGKIASSSFVEISEAALAMEKATGKSVDATVSEFVKIADDPVAAAKSLNDQYHFLTASVYAQIVALKAQGDEIGASKLLTDNYAEAVKGRAGEIIQNLGLVEKAWLAIRGETAKTLDALKNVGRDQDDLLRITEITQKLAYLQSTLGTGYEDGDAKKRMGSLQDELNLLQDKQAAQKENAKFDSDQTRIQKEGIEAEIKLKAISDSNLTNAEKRDKLIKEYQRSVDDLRKANPDSPLVKPDYVAKTIQNIKDKNKDPATASGSVDLTGFNDAKNNLAAITDTYKNYQKELEAAQKAGLLSEEDYLLRRQALIGNQLDQTTAAYEAEIAALEAVKGKKSTSAAQSIQLDQKIADARSGMVKAQKDADSQLEVLATNETGRLAKQERAITSYVQALGQQQKALELAGQRAVLGVGQGDRQNALSGQLNSQQDRFAQQSLELENQRSDPSRNMSEEEFKRKAQALADANKAATDQIRQNYADVENAQGDWTKGATAAWENYLDSAKDIAGQTKSLFGNAFSSMEDSIVNFAMTGKASFSDFAKSILADMARIATRQASSALLGSLVGAAASYLGGSAAGGGNGMAAGSAGATSSNLGASSAGYSSTYFPQALGGAWSGGVQMFADGGAFTNSIVSKPTAFGMANGKTGVMGEAGEEAIMPLTRTSSGKLGVMAMGGGGAGGTQINVEVHIDGDGNASSTADAPGYDLFGKELATFVEQKYQELRSRDMRQGGVINNAIKGR